MESYFNPDAPTDHHVIFYRSLHECMPVYKKFRERRMGLIARLGAGVHRELHDAVPGVPLLDIFTQQRVARMYKPTGENVLENMELYMFAVEAAMVSPKSHTVERQLSSLVLHAVDLQRPFVKDGLIKNPRN